MRNVNSALRSTQTIVLRAQRCVSVHDRVWYSEESCRGDAPRIVHSVSRGDFTPRRSLVRLCRCELLALAVSNTPLIAYLLHTR